MEFRDSIIRRKCLHPCQLFASCFDVVTTHHTSLVDKRLHGIAMCSISMKLGVAQDIYASILRGESKIRMHRLPVLVSLLLAQRLIDLEQNHEAEILLLIAVGSDVARGLIHWIKFVECIFVWALAYQAVGEIGRRTYA